MPARSTSRTPPRGPAPRAPVATVPLDHTARQRYLNYALSVITARALPDVRDGLKPVQRRILFSMFHNHRLSPDRAPVKSAKVVGSVIGEWHPHGDGAVYDAMARMAQWWSLRAPLVDGHGNFGSLDGDPPAAYRYTEARLAPIALELLRELDKDTVDFQANYDGKADEPRVLPARLPLLLINGSTGIAVGMATNIPPHNLGEVITGAITLIDNRDCSIADLMRAVKGPDFPTGGAILNPRAELRELYATGHGSIRLRGEYTVTAPGRGKARIIITSIPFAVDKASIVERIGELIADRKVPQLTDVRDESTTDARIVLELRHDADATDAAAAMAYLFKHTPLQNTVSVNLTCLVPVPGAAASHPQRLNLKQILEQFIDFRLTTVTRRLSHELARLERRLHILSGFTIIIDALDQVLTLIRRSDGKADAARQMQARWRLDGAQTDAILETPIYKISRADVAAMLAELTDTTARVRRLRQLLDSRTQLWNIVKTELREVAAAYGDTRRTAIGGRRTDDVVFAPEAYMIKEDAVITVSADGWIRRVGMVKDLSKTRLREGDALLTALAGSTVETMVCFSNFGSAYTMRIGDVPAARGGYGDPAQKLFKFQDGERIIAAVSSDPGTHPPASPRTGTDLPLRETPPADGGRQILAVSSSGMGVRVDLAPFQEPSTRLGRKFMKLRDREEVVSLDVLCPGSRMPALAVASRQARVLLCDAGDVPALSGAGRGVRIITLDGTDRVLAARLLYTREDQLVVLKQTGGALPISLRKYRPVARGGKGHAALKRGTLKEALAPAVEPPILRDEPRASGR